MTTRTAPNLAEFDCILVNSSAGKDSQAMLDLVVELADAAGVRDRLVVVHCDLGRVEWKGTRELAAEQAAHYGIRFEVVTRAQGDLLEQVEQRGMWPSNSARFCTSDHKRAQVYRLMTQLAAEHRARTGPRAVCRILNAMGLRAAESPAREFCDRCRGKESRPASAGKSWVPVSSCPVCNGTGQRVTLALDEQASNGRRTVTEWLPIHDWSTEQVWSRIRASGVRHHPAYDLGMGRLSCAFCIFAPVAALMLAGQHNGELLAQYVAVEAKIGHSFRMEGVPKDERTPGGPRTRPFHLKVIQDRLAAGERAPAQADGGCWAGM